MKGCFKEFAAISVGDMDMNHAYEYCFFDLDGTIIDSSDGITHSVCYALDKFGISETDRNKLFAFIGPPLTDSFEQFYGFSGDRCMEAVKYYREYYRVKGIYENQVYHGLEEVLRELKQRGKVLVVATSKPEVFAREIIEYYHLDQYFDYVAGMELDGRRGTKAEVIEYALEICGVTDRTKVLMIGDRKYDMEGARSAGIDALGVLYGFGSRAELNLAGADYIAESVMDILSYV